jgi:hypothetical protein
MILKAEHFKTDFKFAFNCKEDPVTKAPINLVFDSDDFTFINNEEDDLLFKLAARAKINEIVDSYQSQSISH